jgi:hypothetical protein
MKLRIKGNSIRWRLTQTEVENVDAGQVVQEIVPFGKGQPSFRYVLYANPETDKILATYVDHTLRIGIPPKQVKQWANTDQVGLEENIVWEDGTTLHVLVEKDFQCLHKRSVEDEEENFPNPAAESQI